MPSARILIADSDPSTLESLSGVLRESGFDVSVADGRESLMRELGTGTPPDLLMLDVMMPGADGVEMLQELKADSRWRHIPVLMVSSPSPEEMAERSFSLGAADFIRKPFGPRELVARVQTHLRMHRELTTTRAEYTRLEVLAHTDPLTQVLNRRALTGRLIAELDRARRYGAELSMLMIDLDHFKTINDSYGHLVGDDVLREVANLLTESVRSVDVVARYGGEEFVVVLPETKLPGAVKFAERMRERIEATSFVTQHGGVRLTASIGVTPYPSGDACTVDDLLARADEALYRAKAEGRNRVCQ